MKYKHELSVDVREQHGRIVKNQKIFGYSEYRLEQIGESYQQSVFLSLVFINHSRAGCYITASTAGRKATRLHHIFGLSLLRLFGLLLFVPTYSPTSPSYSP